MLKSEMPLQPSHSPRQAAPRWRQMVFWAGLAVLLHILALYTLGQAFAPLAPENLPQPIFAHLLLPSAKPVTAAGVAPKAEPRKPRPTPPAEHGLQLRANTVSRNVPPPRTSAPTPQQPQADASAPKPAHPISQPSSGLPPVMPETATPQLARSLSDDGASGQVAISRMPHGIQEPSDADTMPVHASSPTANASGTASSVAPPTSTPTQAQERTSPAATASAVAAQEPDADGWPPSTQLRYALTGNYRGPLYGSGALEWVRDDDHYRVELSGSALVSFAYTSTGRIDHNWLAPDHYVERVFTRRKEVMFNRGKGTLRFSATSTVMPLPPHLQDSASIFMQLAHLLTTEPNDFKTGQTLAFEVARPSGTTTWDFTITGQETVKTGMGTLNCWHLDHPSRAGELGAEVWLAPKLQNLPVQIRLQQDADSYLLFTLSEARQQ